MTDKRDLDKAKLRPFTLTSGEIVFTKALRDRLAEIENSVKRTHDRRLSDGLISLLDYAVAVKSDLENAGAPGIQKTIEDLYILTAIYDRLESSQEKDDLCEAFYAAQNIPALLK